MYVCEHVCVCVCDSIVVPAGQCQWLEHIGTPLLPPTDTLLVGFIALCVTAECVCVCESICAPAGQSQWLQHAGLTLLSH